jgi:hypothetical protein
MKQLMRHIWPRVIPGALVVFLFAALAACAAGLVSHEFSFNASRESPDVQVLDYRYGDSRQPSARANDYEKEHGTVRQSVGIHGDMVRGDALYVKWRLKTSGAVYEDFVDLKSLLPRQIKDHRVHFTIKGRQLFVYLVTPERRPPEMAAIGPHEDHYLKVLTLSSNFGREVTNP